MKFDENKVDEITLALLFLTSFKDEFGGTKAWKGFDWDTLNSLYAKGYIDNPKGKAKSLVLSEEGAKLSEELFKKYFVLDD